MLMEHEVVGSIPTCPIAAKPRGLVNASHKPGAVAQRIERVKRFVTLVFVLVFQSFL